MEEERRRRKRGRRRGRGGGEPPDRGPDRPEGRDQEERGEGVSEESDAPGVLPPRLRFRFGRGGEREEGTSERRREGREERSGAGPRPSISPLSFWRRGRQRAYREQPMPKQTIGRTLRRIRGMYFPPWVPVVFIIVVVFGILAALFVVRGAAGKPRIGQDHWHATYQIVICGNRQPNVDTPQFREDRQGVHTHGDGVIHIHPFIPAAEGAGARLVKWFEYGGGKLSQDEMQIPGQDRVWKNGDTCDDGSEGVLQVFVNGEKLDNWSRYIPQDGDRVRIVFGPEEEAPTELEDRTVIDPAEAARTVDLVVSGGEADAAFDPSTIEARPGETVKVAVKNNGSISHVVRVAGPDGQYNTSDDYVSEPEIMEPGAEGVLVFRFDEEGEYEFQDPTSPAASGTIVVAGEAVPETPGAGDGDGVQADVELDLVVNDGAFEPAELEVQAGQTFLINLKNEGEFVHNLRLAGPDGEFDTEDDLKSTPASPRAGEDGSLVGKLDEPGTYAFRDDFHPTELTGTLVVR